MAIYDVKLENVKQVVARLNKTRPQAQFLTAVTGAGISVASGLPLVNDVVGGVSLRDFFAPALLQREPARYYDVYREALKAWRTATPNAAHKALAAAGIWVVTQNVDGLHRDAGSQRVIELHGNFRELLCRDCSAIFSSQLAWQAKVPTCKQCGRPLEPGIVLEGQEIRHFSRAVDWVGRSQVVLVIGTRLEMDPVRKLPAIAEANDADVVWVNEDAEHVVPALCTTLMLK